MTIDPGIIGWLREDPIVEFHMSADKGESSKERKRALAKVLSLPQVREMIREVSMDPWPPLTSHRDAKHPLHKLSFLAELGASGEELGLGKVMERLVDSTVGEGVPTLPIRISPSHGGHHGEVITWMLCDSPTLAYSLVRLGKGENGKVVSAIDELASLVSPNGYRCVTSPSLGGFRGPGRKEDPCPYANLVMLKLFSVTTPEAEGARNAANALLDQWENSWTKHPYLFYMGTDFRKLKYPMIYFDIVHVVEVLTRFDWLRSDPRLKSMVDTVLVQGDALGRYTPGSVWMAWKDWDFGQKKVPSRALTYQVHSIASRFVGGEVREAV